MARDAYSVRSSPRTDWYKVLCFTIFLSACWSAVQRPVNAASSAMIVQSGGTRQQKVPLLIGIVGQHDSEIARFAQYLKLMLDRANQKTSGFLVTVQSFEKILAKKRIKQLAGEGFPLAIFIKTGEASATVRQSLEWRLYDTRYALMVCGKRFTFQTGSASLLSAKHRAEYLADQLWPVLMGQEGFFCSRIAFCKETQNAPSKKAQKSMCVLAPYADPMHKNYTELSDELLEQPGLLAPRWNKDKSNPLLLYSQAMPANVRLMSVDMCKRRTLVSNFDGLNVLPAFSSDGKRSVYCLSRNGKSQLYMCEHEGQSGKLRLQKVAGNDGNNLCPTLRDNGDIIFCSDARGAPKLCYYHVAKREIEILTTDGAYCACPQFCEKNGKIAYSCFVDGCMQLCLYDLGTRTTEQITFDSGNKEECSWSPCGNYLAFVVEQGTNSRIAIHNCLTGERSFLTAANERCRYPAWSPRYDVPLVVASA